MKRHQKTNTQRAFQFRPRIASLAVAACFITHITTVSANPTGAQVAAGSAQFSSSGNTLTVSNAPNTIINWQQFNIGANETTRFVQQSATSAVLNRVVGGDMSQIYGTLQSNGQVYLINQNGILFGSSAIIDVNKLVASTLNLSDADFLAKRFSFSGGGFGSLINQGSISTALGGSVYLIGTDVRNEGIITSPQGTILLSAGNTVDLIDSAGPELSVTISATGNKAVNLGTVNASGGSINMFGALIEQQGVLRADSASVDEQGRIVLKATDSTTVSGTISANNSVGQAGEIQVLGDKVTLTATSSLSAAGATGGGTVLVGGDWQGSNAAVQNATTTTMEAGATITADATQNGNGGKVVLWSNGTTDFKGSIFARGGASGGNGGNVEVSGHQLRFGGTVNTLAPFGAAGTLLLDPASFCVRSGTATCASYNGYSSTTYYEESTLLSQLISNGSVTVLATEFILIDSLDFSGLNISGRTLSFQAPLIYQNGSINEDSGLSVPLNISFNATGVFSADSTLSGKLVSEGSIYTQGGSLVMKADKEIVFQGSGQTIDISDANDSGWKNMEFHAPTILRNASVSFNNPNGDIDFYANKLSGSGTWTGTSEYLGIATYTKGFDIYLGEDNTNAACGVTALCLKDQFTTPNAFTVNDVGIYAAHCSIKDCSISQATFDGNIYIGGATSWSMPGTDSLEIIGKDITIKQAITKSWSSSQNSNNVVLGIFAYNTLTNLAGASALSSANSGGKTWAIAVGNYAGSSFGGLETAPTKTVKYSNWLASQSSDTDWWETLTGSNFILDFDIGNSANDPRALSQTQTQQEALTQIDKMTSTALTLSAPLTIDATLTLDDRYAVKSDVTTTITNKLDAILTVSEGPSVQEIRGEARKLRDDATQSELEAKRAEAEAKQAEDEAKSIKNPAKRTEALKRAEAKRLEATVKKARAEAQRAEADAREAQADAKQVASTSPATGKPAGTTAPAASSPVKRAEVEVKVARAEGKRAEAEAKQADAEAKQAAQEVKAAKSPEQKNIAQKTVESKRIEADAKRTEAKARQIEAEGKQAEVEAKTATTPQARAAAEKKAETKLAEADIKKTEAGAKQAAADGKQAEANAGKAEVKAKQAESEAKQAEAEVRSAKTPEQKQVATQKAESKKSEVQAHKEESTARKTEAEAKGSEAKAMKAEGEAKKAEQEAKSAKTPEVRAKAEKRAETQKDKADVLKTESEAQKTKSEAHQAKSEAKQAESEAKAARSPGGRAVSEKRAEAKKAEGEHKEKEASAKKAEAEEKRARSEEKQARNDAKSEKNQQKKAEAEKKAEEKKAEAEQKKAEKEAKKAEAEQKKAEAEKKKEEHRVAEEKRKEERRAEAAQAFGKIVTAGASRDSLAAVSALRHELKTEALKPALKVLDGNPAAADLPPCGAGSVLCVPQGLQAATKLPPAPMPTISFLPQIQRKVALVIGVNKYNDPSIPSLETALPDAQAVGEQLKDQLGYELRVVPDASRADIVTSLNRLALEVGPEDSVTVYYAGHGYLDAKSGNGYWIPGDAKVTSPANWISNNDISKLLSNIPAKQLMLVSDSCYSGSLTKQQVVGSGNVDPARVLAKRSVTVMSSGGEEPVSDEGKDGHSIFAYNFMNALKSVKQVESAGRLFETVKTEVTKDFPQEPQYGGALSAGHNTGGDYLFETRSFK